MPWKEILDSLHRVAEADEPVAPHPPEMLAHVVRLHMKIGGKDAEVAKFVKEIRVRTHVVLTLGKELIEGHHPAFTKKAAGGGRVLKASAA